MKILYYVLVVIIVIVVAYFINAKGLISIPYFSDPKVTQITNSITVPSVSLDTFQNLEQYIPQEKIPDEVNKTIAGIYTNAQSASTVAAQVLGAAIQATQSGDPIHEKAWEYGKYMYCQQVVKEWEAQQSIAPTNP